MIPCLCLFAVAEHMFLQNTVARTNGQRSPQLLSLLGKDPSLFLPASGGSRHPLAFLGLWQHPSNLRLCHHMASLWVFCICPNFPPIRSAVIVRATLKQYDLILITYSKTPFPNMATFTVWGLGPPHTFLGNSSTHNSVLISRIFATSVNTSGTLTASSCISSPESYFSPLTPVLLQCQ